MSDSRRLVPLVESSDQVELTTWCSLLTGAGIKHVVQGELHASLVVGLFGNPTIVPCILVAQEDEERARRLLEATPALEGPQGTPLLDGFCTVHELPGTAPCDRCGNFLCSHCKTIGQPPLCESCAAVEGSHLQDGLDKGQRYKRWIFSIVLGLFLASLAARFLR